MKARFDRRTGAAVVIAVFFAAVISVGVSKRLTASSSTAGEGPTATATATSGQGEPPITANEENTFTARGFDAAPQAIKPATSRLPFPAAVPGFLPGGFRPWLVSVASLIDRPGLATLSLLYISGDFLPLGVSGPRPRNLQIFQATGVERPDVKTVETTSIGGVEWKYRFRPPDVTIDDPVPYGYVSVSLTDSAGVYLELTIDVGGAGLDATLAELDQIISSLPEGVVKPE